MTAAPVAKYIFRTSPVYDSGRDDSVSTTRISFNVCLPFFLEEACAKEELGGTEKVNGQNDSVSCVHIGYEPISMHIDGKFIASRCGGGGRELRTTIEGKPCDERRHQH